MTSQDILASLRTTFQKFRKTPWFRVTYLILLGLIVAQLYLLTASAIACVVILLMPVLAFVVPYWLGERKPRRLAVNALPIFLVAILIAGAMSTQALLAQDRAVPIQSFPNFRSSPTMALSNGTVTPYRGDPSQPFTFRVKLTTTVDGAPPENFTVYLNLTIITGLTAFDRPSHPMVYSPGNGSSNNTKNGTWYVAQENLTDSIYGYGFAVKDQGSNWTAAGPDFGPLTAPGTTFYGFFLYVTAFSMILPFTFYFVILFMWWYTVRARQTRARTTGGEVDIPKEKTKPKPARDEKAAKATAFTCTNCGADVGETDEKCPKCGAVFEE